MSARHSISRREASNASRAAAHRRRVDWALIAILAVFGGVATVTGHPVAALLFVSRMVSVLVRGWQVPERRAP